MTVDVLGTQIASSDATALARERSVQIYARTLVGDGSGKLCGCTADFDR